jgi:hypothetical protein
MNYSEGIERIRAYTAGGSILPVLEFIHSVQPPNSGGGQSILEEIGGRESYPETLKGLLEFLSHILRKRKTISILYDKSMERYQTFAELTSRRRSTDEESKIKKTLTDFILRLEKLFEINDLTDESIVKELNRFVNESNLYSLTESEMERMMISSKTMTLLEPHLDRLREIYFGYEKLMDSFHRLVRISDYILEESQKKAI